MKGKTRLGLDLFLRRFPHRANAEDNVVLRQSDQRFSHQTHGNGIRRRIEDHPRVRCDHKEENG